MAEARPPPPGAQPTIGGWKTIVCMIISFFHLRVHGRGRDDCFFTVSQSLVQGEGRPGCLAAPGREKSAAPQCHSSAARVSSPPRVASVLCSSHASRSRQHYMVLLQHFFSSSFTGNWNCHSYSRETVKLTLTLHSRFRNRSELSVTRGISNISFSLHLYK
ncbi:hypothetical protein E2C01_028637 [Portunus trituberculatus]|uniref:Uncharacterized protein n=1 Tax=Portunus trituberculatus TaxID=210409 RepID=A0A5B7EQ06_PORTR|nr:hypothetical protein [Portunus trituberculatus]